MAPVREQQPVSPSRTARRYCFPRGADACWAAAACPCRHESGSLALVSPPSLRRFSPAMRLTRTVATTREKPAEQARGSAIQANARQLHRIQQIAPVESHPRYSLIERDVEPDIPMGSGMLMGGMTHEWIEHWPRLPASSAGSMMA